MSAVWYFFVVLSYVISIVQADDVNCAGKLQQS